PVPPALAPLALGRGRRPPPDERAHPGHVLGELLGRPLEPRLLGPGLRPDAPALPPGPRRLGRALRDLRGVGDPPRPGHLAAGRRRRGAAHWLLPRAGAGRPGRAVTGRTGSRPGLGVAGPAVHRSRRRGAALLALPPTLRAARDPAHARRDRRAL